MSSTKILATASILTIALAGAAHSQGYADARETTGPYISGGYNYLDFNEELGGSADISAITARGGWQFTPFLSVEGDISFGVDDGNFDFNSSEDDLDFDDNTDGDLDDVINGPGELGMDYLIGLYARATLPLSDRFEVSARGGYAFVELDSTVQTIGGNELVFGGSDDGFAFGGSASYDLTESLSLRADYTHYEFDDANAESFGVNLQVKF